jgi:hypothetical protein
MAIPMVAGKQARGLWPAKKLRRQLVGVKTVAWLAVLDRDLADPALHDQQL